MGLRRSCSSCSVLGDSRVPTVAARFLDLVVDMLVVFNDRCWGSLFLVGPCAQAQGQGLTPAIRAGKGWRGRRERAPRRSATRIRCMPVRSYRQRHVRYTLVSTTTTTQALVHKRDRFLSCCLLCAEQRQAAPLGSRLLLCVMERGVSSGGPLFT